MTGLEIWLLAIGLAMDCFAVSIASGIILKRVQLRPMLIMALAFGFFQALMPLLGWIGASFFSHLIESIDHWIAFAILAFLGGRMIMESFKDEDCRHEFDPIGIIGLVSFALSLAGLMFGIRCGCGIARKLRSELWGGIILIVIGTKILIEHLFF